MLNNCIHWECIYSVVGAKLPHNNFILKRPKVDCTEATKYEDRYSLLQVYNSTGTHGSSSTVDM